MAINETIVTSIIAPLIGVAVLYGNTIVQGIKRRAESNERELEDLRNAMSAMQQDVVALTKDLAIMTEQNSFLKKEVGRLTEENSGLKTQMNKILIEAISAKNLAPAT